MTLIEHIVEEDSLGRIHEVHIEAFNHVLLLEGSDWVLESHVQVPSGFSLVHDVLLLLLLIFVFLYRWLLLVRLLLCNNLLFIRESLIVTVQVSWPIFLHQCGLALLPSSRRSVVSQLFLVLFVVLGGGHDFWIVLSSLLLEIFLGHFLGLLRHLLLLLHTIMVFDLTDELVWEVNCCSGLPHASIC